MKDTIHHLPLRRALLYAFLAGVWIIGSDWLLAQLVGDVAQSHLLQTVKGWFFIIVTTIFLYYVLHKDLSKLQREIDTRTATEEALRDSEARLIRAQHVAKMGDFTWDLETGQVSWSHGIYDLLGYDRSEVIDPDFVQDHIHHPDDRDRVKKWLTNTLQSDATTLSANEYRVIRKDGSIVHLRTQGVLERRPGKKPRLFATVVDITDHVKATQEREKLQQQVIQAQKMESVGRLAGGIAHDFNNILSVVMGYTELALAKVDKHAPVHDYLSEVLNASRRSTDITRQLLAFARRQPIDPKLLDLNRSIEGMLKMLRRLIGEHIVLTWKPGEDLGMIMIDPSQIDQLLANLCINARDAVDGGGTIMIETGQVFLDDAYCAAHPTFTPGDYVSLTVSDNGCGMDRDTLKNLFEPFFTTKAEGHGTGLGLATVFGIVKQNNGFIDVYSEPGHGATFKIYLPRHEEAADLSEGNETQPVDVRGTETVLVVEDAQAILKLTERMLSQLGYRVLTALHPHEAIALAKHQQQDIHLLLTDVIMPDMNGPELASQVQQDQPAMKILFMSGYTASMLIDRGLLKAEQQFIAKPFSKQQLAERIRHTLTAQSQGSRNLQAHD
ncbi:MAG: response regulator [Desulfofustis sp.]|jgi:PAS domain S-box-containing protein|nr:response regulator [Desulfofustis sp.]